MIPYLLNSIFKENNFLESSPSFWVTRSQRSRRRDKGLCESPGAPGSYGSAFVTERAVQCATNIGRNLVMLQLFLSRVSLALGLLGQCEVGMCSNHLFNTRLESSSSTIFADPGNVSVDGGVAVFKLVRITYCNLWFQ